MTRTILTLSGRVQGVGFRYTVLRIATRYDVAGTVRNLRDGRVEVDAEGSAAAVDAFLQDVLANPPRGARIEHAARGGAEPRLLQTFSEAPTA